jgi:hypothetical protein
VIARFLRQKAAPVPGAVYDFLSGETPDRKAATPLEVGKGLVLPFGPQDVYDAMRDQGVPRGVALALLAVLGMGVATHERRGGR